MYSDVLDLFNGFEGRGWNDDTKLQLLAQFINDHDLKERARNFLADIAAEEEDYVEQEDEEEELLEVRYKCPDCGHEWVEEWDCACDSECPECETGNISALEYRKVGTELWGPA
jgi:hypothetical protein